MVRRPQSQLGGLGERSVLPSGVRNLKLFRRFFEDKMHRLVTLQVVTPKLHTVPMRTIGRDAAEILLGDATSWIGTFLS